MQHNSSEDYNWRNNTLGDYVGVHNWDYELVEDFYQYAMHARGAGRDPTSTTVLKQEGNRLTIRVCEQDTHEVVDFGRYNYLGLAHHPEVMEGARKALERFGMSPSASPMSNGVLALHEELSERLERLFGFEKVLLLSSGYNANMAAITGIMRQEDTVIMDHYCHPSLRDGVAGSTANKKFFGHNSPDSLETRLKRVKNGAKLVVVEGLYSSEGDRPPLQEIVEVARRYDARVMIDEAHSVGNFGANGGGTSELLGMRDQLDIFMGTFSKTFGGVGGFLGGSRELMEYLAVYGRAYMFSCAISPVITGGLLGAVNVLEREGPERRRRLEENGRFIRELLVGEGFNIAGSESHIIPIIFGADNYVLDAGAMAWEMGIMPSVMVFPAVPRNASRLRLFINSEHTREELTECVEILKTIYHRFNIPLGGSQKVGATV